MKKAIKEDRELIVKLLAESFEGNLSVNYIISPGGDRKKHIKRLMEYSFDLCMMFGDVWLSDDELGCALTLYPEKRKTNLSSVWLDLKLIFTSIGILRTFKALRRESQIKEKQLKLSMHYLWFIAVSPNHQKQGIGSGLLAAVGDHAGKAGKAVCLETSTITNLPWYQKNHFQIYDQLDLGYTLYFLKHVPAN